MLIFPSNFLLCLDFIYIPHFLSLQILYSGNNYHLQVVYNGGGEEKGSNHETRLGLVLLEVGISFTCTLSCTGQRLLNCVS